MSARTERHEEAMRLWRMLDSMSDSELKERLGDGESEVYAAPCTAMLTLYIFDQYGRDGNGEIDKERVIDEEDRLVYWTKLRGRSVGNVWNFYQYARGAPPEEFALRISQFAKKYPPVRGVE